MLWTKFYAWKTKRRIVIETEEGPEQFCVRQTTFFCSLKDPVRNWGKISQRTTPVGMEMATIVEAVKLAETCCIENHLPPTATFIYLSERRFPVTVIVKQIWRD